MVFLAPAYVACTLLIVLPARTVRRRLESDNLSSTHHAERPKQPSVDPVSSLNVAAGSPTIALHGRSMSFLADPSSPYQSPYERHEGLASEGLAQGDIAPGHPGSGGTEEGNSAIYAATLDDKACGHDLVPFYAGTNHYFFLPHMLVSLTSPIQGI